MNMKTTIVIGAGASAEANLPTGKKLKKKIARLLDIKVERGFVKDSDGYILDAISLHMQEQVEQDKNPYFSAMRHISDAMPLAISIDNFIDMHAGNKNIELCGKLAIVRSILEAEQSSLIYSLKDDRSRQPDYSQLEQTWFNSFFQKLTENCRLEDLPRRLSSISLIIFNYDRCVEQFLHSAFQTSYGIDTKAAAELIKSINIYHPYGVVGSLPWQKRGVGANFGADVRPDILLEIARGIRTFTEGTDPHSSNVQDIQGSIYDAERLLFLGFAFHDLNMELLSPSPKDSEVPISPSPVNTQIYASAFGFSDTDLENIRNQLQKLRRGDLATANVRSIKCVDLFGEFSKSISF